jgi:tetratricopeptide (TPR) repeat protein
VSTARDARGCEVTGASAPALEHFERALAGFLAWNGEPREEARHARTAAPAFVMGHLLEAHLYLCSRDPADMREARRALQRARGLAQNARERMHAAAIATALAGDYKRARELLGIVLARHPRDLVALAVSHTIDHYLGDTRGLHARVAAVMPAWSAADPGYHGVLAMLAFGLEEAGEFGRAEDAALAALALEPGSLRAHHARAHVLEMQGRAAEGIRWMGERAAFWTGQGASSTHLWWHLALHHLELGNARHALEIYDRRIAGAAPSLNELIDASALLWRLELRGVDLGARWRALAERWAPHAEDAFCAFNDLHAMMAFVGAGRRDLARRLLRAQRKRLAQGGTNQLMLLEVGWPACQALEAFGKEDYISAAAMLRGLPEVSHWLGGSHAQRGLIGLTLRAAEYRARIIGVRPRLAGYWGQAPIFRLPAARAT